MTEPWILAPKAFLNGKGYQRQGSVTASRHQRFLLAIKAFESIGGEDLADTRKSLLGILVFGYHNGVVEGVAMPQCNAIAKYGGQHHERNRAPVVEGGFRCHASILQGLFP